MKSTTTIMTANLSLSLLATGTASAYEYMAGSHSGTSHTLYLDPWVQILMPSHYDKLQAAATKVNANSSAMRFTLANDNEVFQDPNNGESEAGFTSDSGKLCGSLACATVWSLGGVITETDVWFDVDYDWTLTDYKYDSLAYDSAMYRPLVNTAIHEFTHSLGMAHENDYFQVMGNAWNVVSTNGDYTESVISEDTTKGLRDLYGPRGWQNEDLSLYHWELAGASGAYSTHGRTDLSYPGGVPIPQLIGSLEPV